MIELDQYRLELPDIEAAIRDIECLFDPEKLKKRQEEIKK